MSLEKGFEDKKINFKTKRDRLEEELKEASIRLDGYKDESPVPLPNLLVIYKLIGSTKDKQNNANITRETFPAIIKGYITYLRIVANKVKELPNIGEGD